MKLFLPHPRRSECRVSRRGTLRAISPRDSLRVQPAAGGGFSSQYIGRAPIDGPAPEAPWAVHLMFFSIY